MDEAINLLSSSDFHDIFSFSEDRKLKRKQELFKSTLKEYIKEICKQQQKMAPKNLDNLIDLIIEKNLKTRSEEKILLDEYSVYENELTSFFHHGLTKDTSYEENFEDDFQDYKWSSFIPHKIESIQD